MNIRIKNIILEIIKNDAISIFNLAEIFDVSERSIRNDIKELNEFLLKNNLNKIVILANKSIDFCKEDILKCLELLNDFNYYDYKLSKKERIYLIIEMLINNDDFINIADIAEKLYISISTINSDLKDIAAYLIKHDIKYISMPYYGIKVEGSEFNKRTLLLDNIADNSPLFNIELSKSIKKNYKEVGLNKINQIVSFFENKTNILLTDESFKRLNNYLYIMIHRIREGIYITNIDSDIDNLDLDISLKLSSLIEEEFNIKLNEYEVIALSLILKNLKYLKSQTVSNEIIKIQFYLNRFIESIKKLTNIDISNDYLFFIRLSMHIEYMNRKKISQIVSDRVLKEVIDENKDIVHAVNESIEILEELLNRKIKKIEKEYIVLHVCAAIERKMIDESRIKVLIVSDKGIASTQLLIAKINSNFEFSVVDVLPVHSFSNKISKDIDLIISTVDIIDNNILKPFVVVNMNFTDDDYTKIHHLLNKIRKNKILNFDANNDIEDTKQEISEVIKSFKLENEKEIIKKVIDVIKKPKNKKLDEPENQILLSEYLKPDFIKLNVSVDKWEDSVIESAKILLDKKYIKKEYINKMINKIKNDGPYMAIGNGFIVPHAGIDDGGIKTGFSLITLKEPIDFSVSCKNIKYVFCLSVVDISTHLKAFFELVDLVHKKEFINEIYKCNTSKCIYDLIKKFEEENY